MLRPFTIFGSLLLLSTGLFAQDLDGTFHEVKASVKSLDITETEEKGAADTIAKGSYKSPKKGVYVVANDDGDGGYILDLWYSEDGETFTEYEGAGTIGPVIDDEKKGAARPFAEFALDITTVPALDPGGEPAEGISVGGIVAVKIKEDTKDAVESANEVQTVTIGTAPGKGETFTLTLNHDYGKGAADYTSAPIADDADAAAIKAALEAPPAEGVPGLPAGSTVTVVGGVADGSFTVEFGGDLAETDVSDMTADFGKGAGAATIAETQMAAVGVPAGIKSASFKLQKPGAVSVSFDGLDIGTPNVSLKYVPEDKLPEGLMPVMKK